jgi:hypothetical protein
MSSQTMKRYNERETKNDKLLSKYSIERKVQEEKYTMRGKKKIIKR